MSAASRHDGDDRFRHTHELRTALTGIKAHAQLLVRQVRRTGAVEPGGVQSRAEAIDQLTGRMVEAIARIEDLIRQSGRGRSGAPTDGQ